MGKTKKMTSEFFGVIFRALETKNFIITEESLTKEEGKTLELKEISEKSQN